MSLIKKLSVLVLNRSDSLIRSEGTVTGMPGFASLDHSPARKGSL